MSGTAPSGTAVTAGTAGTAGTVRRWLRAVHWYLREVSGEADYDRYLARHGELHPGDPAVGRAEFERRRWEDRANTPGTRCC